MCPEDTDRPPDEGTGDSTATFRADYSAKLEAPAADAEAGLRSVQVLPSSPARLVVKRGPNAGARFLLTKPVTSVGRHPGSDIFLDHVTVSRPCHREPTSRRIPLRKGQLEVFDAGSINGTYVNQQPVTSAPLVNDDEIQIGTFCLVFLTEPRTA